MVLSSRGFFSGIFNIIDERTRVPVDFLRTSTPETAAKVFFVLIIIITVIAVLANISAIYSITYRQCKILQKSCIICLAVADIFSVLVYSVNNLDALQTRDLKVWRLGSFFCLFATSGQLLGTSVSSVCLLIIALDRYWNIIHAMSKRWDPSLWKCISTAVLIWVVCAAISFPACTTFTYIPIYLVWESNKTEEAYMCISTSKTNLQEYFISMTILIFLPIFIAFIWLYYKIAALIWRHRKPVSSNYKEKESEQSSENSATTTHHVSIKKEKNVQVERKIRTFKIVVGLMLAFVFCRMPYWIYYVFKLSIKVVGPTTWIVHYTVITLNLLNCAFNPFLYTFLNTTITILKAVNEFFWKILCCCFSNPEFDEFEKENPFIGEFQENNLPNIVAEHKKYKNDDNRPGRF